MSKTLYDYLCEKEAGDEITVWDKDYDIEVYFYPSEGGSDKWDKAMEKVAAKLTVIEEGEDEYSVVVDLCDVIERNLNNGMFEKLFIHNNVDDIMDDIESIFAGNVSEEWIADFAESLV